MAKRVKVGALEIEYDEVGPDQTGNIQANNGERPFVLLHGFAGSRDDFADVLLGLGELGPTLVPDQRGHGGSSNLGEGYTLDQLTADISDFLDSVGVQECDLLGHSLGGLVALRLALAQP
jgi:pimeloyl-ACP methyl ester carboxylesterase